MRWFFHDPRPWLKGQQGGIIGVDRVFVEAQGGLDVPGGHATFVKSVSVLVDVLEQVMWRLGNSRVPLDAVAQVSCGWPARRVATRRA